MLNVIEASDSALYLYGCLSKDPLAILTKVSGRLALVDLANQEAELVRMQTRHQIEKRGEDEKEKKQRKREG